MTVTVIWRCPKCGVTYSTGYPVAEGEESKGEDTGEGTRVVCSQCNEAMLREQIIEK